jgi:putative DNA primase/helicase
VRFFRKRLVSASEGDVQQKLAMALLKEMSGGEPLRARELFRESFQFRVTHKLILSSNHKPRIDDASRAAWRRIRLVRFGYDVPQPDRALPAKLREELPGILAWAVEGCRAWRSQGLGSCPAVEKATEQYHGEQDRFRGFLNACCVLGVRESVLKRDLHLRYREWAEEQGLFPMQVKRFGKTLKQHVHKLVEGKRGDIQLWRGIGLQKRGGADGEFGIFGS